MKVRGKVIVVTGGGSGMGRELVLQLLHRRARVAAVDVARDALQQTARLAEAYGDRLSTHVVDITDAPAVRALPPRVIELHGQVDGVINNAGIIQPFVPVDELDDARIDRVMHVNFFGTLNMVRAFLPVLRERPEAHIANVSSMGGFMPFPGQTIYGASKAAVKLLTEGLQSELADTKVKVTAIFPGAVATNITTNSKVDGPTLADIDDAPIKPLAPNDAAKIMLDAIEGDKTRVMVGKDARFLDKLSRVAPERAARFIARKMKDMPK